MQNNYPNQPDPNQPDSDKPQYDATQIVGPNNFNDYNPQQSPGYTHPNDQGYQPGQIYNPQQSPGYQQGAAYNPQQSPGYQQGAAYNPQQSPGYQQQGQDYQQQGGYNPQQNPGSGYTPPGGYNQQGGGYIPPSTPAKDNTLKIILIIGGGLFLFIICVIVLWVFGCGICGLLSVAAGLSAPTPTPFVSNPSAPSAHTLNVRTDAESTAYTFYNVSFRNDQDLLTTARQRTLFTSQSSIDTPGLEAVGQCGSFANATKYCASELSFTGVKATVESATANSTTLRVEGEIVPVNTQVYTWDTSRHHNSFRQEVTLTRGSDGNWYISTIKTLDSKSAGLN